MCLSLSTHWSTQHSTVWGPIPSCWAWHQGNLAFLWFLPLTPPLPHNTGLNSFEIWKAQHDSRIFKDKLLPVSLIQMYCPWVSKQNQTIISVFSTCVSSTSEVRFYQRHGNLIPNSNFKIANGCYCHIYVSILWSLNLIRV